LVKKGGFSTNGNALDRSSLPSLWPMQEGTNFTQIEVVVLEQASFLLSEKPRCPFVNPVGDDIYAPMNQLLGCFPWNFFGDGTSTFVYKPSDIVVWLKLKNGNKICRPDFFKLSILYIKANMSVCLFVEVLKPISRLSVYRGPETLISSVRLSRS
jgi:hypothetical protein